MNKHLAAHELIAAVHVELARSPADIEAILTLATSRLSRMRPGTWVAVVMNPDPQTSRIVVADDRDRAMAQYVNDYVATIDGPVHVPTIGLSQQVIESGSPVAKKVTFDDFLTMLSPAGQAYCRRNPPPGDVRSVDIVIAPMRVGGATLGTLGMLDARGRGAMDEHDVDCLQVVADRVALSVDHARLVEQAMVHAGEIDVVRTIALAHRHSRDLRLTLRAIVERVIALPDVDAADIMLLTDDGRELVLAASAGYRSAWPSNLRIEARWAALEHQARRTEINPCAPVELKGYNPRRSQFAREGFKTMIGIPVHAQTRAMGVLNLYSRSLVEWNQNWLEFFDVVGGLTAMTIDRATAPTSEVVAPRARRPAFTDLETEIVRLIAEGYTNHEVADQVHRSENTVKYHVRRILERTEAANRTDLVRRALREGWILPLAAS